MLQRFQTGAFMSNETDRRLLIAIVLGLVVVVVLVFMLINEISIKPAREEIQARELDMEGHIIMWCFTRTNKSQDECIIWMQGMMDQHYDEIMACSHGDEENNRRCLDLLIRTW